MQLLSVSKLNNIRNVLQWRWWLIAGTALLIVLIETVEHNWLEAQSQTSDNYVLVEIAQYGTIFIIAEGILLTLADRASAKSLENAVRKERQSIAREIHDSLGENISYLHLKLEYLASAQTFDPEMQRELEQAQRVADEAYKQIRGTLVKLSPGDPTDIAAALFDQARSIGHRANFVVDFAAEGIPSPLPLDTQLAIVSIFREALINVEKHAHARKVSIRVAWKPEALSVQLSDNGQGFNINTPVPEDHFGCRIMKERAREIEAYFTLRSQSGSGTEVTLQVPILKH